MRRWTTLGLAALAASGCARGDHRGDDDPPAEPTARTAAVSRPPAARQPPPEPPSPAELAALRTRTAARADSVRAAFGRVGPLRPREVAELRQDRNAGQVATAQTLGTRVSGTAQMAELRRRGELVPLGDSTAYWVLRGMDHSVPYVTPDARAMLVELGRRFHARLDAAGLPRYRMKVTSALRTPGTQAELRKTNSYAARSTSAHEFGTTVDVSHERFAVPADTAGGGAPEARHLEVEMLEEVGKEHARALQAELGRAIAEMRDAGALHVMMENRQPVYHMTVARRFAPPAGPR